jgi:hypothetical protein
MKELKYRLFHQSNSLFTQSDFRFLIQLVALLSSMLLVTALKAQPVIANVYPNGTNMFQPSSTLTFTASSSAGVTNVTVALTVTSLYKGTSFVKNLSASSGLTITGPTTALSVSAVLTSNTLYSAAIQIGDATGAVANQTVTFDTISPSYTWEAEDWDYDGGQFIDNPQTNSYAGRTTGFGDAQNSNGGAAYRPIDPGLSTEGIGSPETSYQRLQYIGTGQQDYDVGFTDGVISANTRGTILQALTTCSFALLAVTARETNAQTSPSQPARQPSAALDPTNLVCWAAAGKTTTSCP